MRGRLQDMIDAINAIVTVIEGLDEPKFLNDRRSRDAAMSNLTVLGEAVRGVPDELQAAHPEVPWAKMRGLRNLLGHEYFGIDDQIVWTTAFRDVVPLLGVLRKVKDGRSRGSADSRPQHGLSGAI